MSKILFISPNPVWGGAATASIAVAKMLRDNGHIIVYNDEYLNNEEYDSIPIDHTKIHQNRFSDRKFMQKLIKDNHINCIIWSPLVAIYFYHEIKQLKKQGIKQIAIIHSLSLNRNIKGRIMDYLVSLTLTNMSAIVYVSQYTKNIWNSFRTLRRSKIKKIVIHNFVDIKGGCHTLDIERPRIGFVGRLSEEKQPQIFCNLSVHKQYDFIVYGDGPLLSDLKSKYKEIKFKGHCSNLKQIYSDIDILVMTSKFENCPMVILEAQAFAIPCIAPKVGGISELIENGVNGILYDNYDTGNIINAIREILSNYSRFSTNSLQCSKRHTSLSAINLWNDILK